MGDLVTDAGRAILITAINYAPETSGIAPYTTDLAEHWATRHRVTVVAGVPHYPSWRVAPGHRRRSSEEWLNGVRLLRRLHYVPPRQSALHRAAYEASFLVNGALAPAERPDAVIGVIPSLSGGLLARLASTRWHVPYSLIVQDLMGPGAAQSGMAGGRQVTRAVARGEAWAARRACRVAIVSEAFRPYLIDRGVRPERIVLLRNWTHVGAPTAHRQATRTRMGWPDNRRIVLHAGNMGLKQGLDQVVSAARLAADRRTADQFVLMGDGNQRVRLEALAGDTPSISFLPFQPEADLPDILAAADVLLISERSSVVDMSLPSKLTSYLMAGRPIIAAVRNDGATAAEVQSARAGMVVPPDDPDALLGAVAHLTEVPDLARAYADSGRRYAVETLGRQAAIALADAFLATTLASRGPTRKDPVSQ
jgi:colanic acid biosynthesis glycosyl transferase WcaI